MVHLLLEKNGSTAITTQTKVRSVYNDVALHQVLLVSGRMDCIALCITRLPH